MSGPAYAIGEGWRDILAQVQIDPVDVLRRARLPEDLLNRDNVKLTADGLVRFMEALDTSVGDPGLYSRY